MKIKIEQNGGFAGLSAYNEIDADKLPPPLEGTIRELLDGRKLLLTKALRRPKGAADYLNYKITIQSGMKDHVIECSELDMDSSLKSLVNYVKKNSKKK